MSTHPLIPPPAHPDVGASEHSPPDYEQSVNPQTGPWTGLEKGENPMQPKQLARFLLPLTLLIMLAILLLPSRTAIFAQDPQDRWAGVVSDENGAPLAATVTINGYEGEASADGSFELYVPRADDERYVINADLFGYVPVSKIHVGRAIEELNLTLKQPQRFEINAEEPVEVEDERGTQISLPANSLVDANGNPATRPLQLLIYTYDLTQEEMPGDMGALNSDGEPVALESAGAFYAKFIDTDGNEYNLAPDAQAEISIPVEQSSGWPLIIPLWSYDETLGVWKEEGQATQANGRYEGSVTHFSVWNFDIEKTNPACIEITIDALYLVNNGLSIDARVEVYSPPSVRTITMSAPTNALYNLPAHTWVDIFIPDTAALPYATVYTGGPWGGTGIPPHSGDNNDPYPDCNGSLHVDDSAPNGTISGIKFNDLNGNGVQDAGELGLSGWTILLENENGGVLSAVTDANGNYSFTGLLPGTYTVSEQFQTGWTQTHPASASHLVTLASDEVVDNINFGNWQNSDEKCSVGWDINVFNTDSDTIEVGMRIYNDSGSNATYQVDVVGSPGFVVTNFTLTTPFDPSQPLPTPPVSVANGSSVYVAVFMSPLPIIDGPSGQYQVIVTNEATGHSFGCSAQLWQSDVIGVRPEENVLVRDIAFGAAQELRFELHNIADREIVANIEIDEMFGVNGNELNIIRLNGQEPGQNVIDQIVIPEGEVVNVPVNVEFDEHVPEGIGDIILLVDVDNDGQVDTATSVMIRSVEPEQSGSISGIKFHDVNGNGVQDADEPGLEGWEITLTDADGNIITTTTDANGNYQFTTLPAGSYTLSEVQQDGWTQTFPAASGTHTVELSADEALENIDFGNWQNQSPPGEFVVDEVLVVFNDELTEDKIDGINEQFGVEVIDVIEEISVYRLRIPDETSVLEMVADYQQLEEVVYAEPNYFASIDLTPNDPSFPQQWGLHNTTQTGGTLDADIDAPEAWDITTGNASVLIAIVDTGIDYNHPDLDAAGRYVGGHDFVNSDSDPMDDQGHGTHVAGIATADTNDGTGIAGVSWDSTYMGVKVLDHSGSGTYADVANGVIYAAKNQADVINLSLGGPSPSTTLQNAMQYAYNQGSVSVCAAGNTGTSPVDYPARYDTYCIGVAATDHNDQRASFSSIGPEVDVAAPGVNILSTLRNGGYASWNGTSMAAPHVAGLAALIRAEHPNSSVEGVKKCIRDTADDVNGGGEDDFLGTGRINAYQALTECQMFDVWTEDNTSDIGIEPHNAGTIWHSPDIKVCHNSGGCATHQNPEFGQNNYINVTLRNNGPNVPPTQPAVGDLHVYYSASGGAAQWNPVPVTISGKTYYGDWVLIDTVPNVSLNAAQVKDIEIPWAQTDIPNPGHYCFLTRWESPFDPMAFPEVAQTTTNVRNNNNLSWKNFNVVSHLQNVSRPAEFVVRNITPEAAIIDLVIQEEQNFLGEGGGITLDLRHLFQRWQNAGGNGDNIELLDGTKIQLLSSPATIVGIPMDADEDQTVELTTQAFEPMPHEGTSYEYHLDMIQVVDEEAVGGVSFNLITRALDTDTDGDGILDVDDDDDDNDGIPDAEDVDPVDPTIGLVAPSISGTVTDPDNNPLSGIQAALYHSGSSGSWDFYDSTDTISGTYELAGLEDGTYRVCFHDPSSTYAFECYDDAPNVNNANNIVIAGNSVTNIDAQLHPDGGISGTVFDYNNVPLENVEVAAFQQIAGDWWYMTSTLSSSAGQYNLQHLTPGEYAIEFVSPDSTAYSSEYFFDARDIDDAFAVSVQPGLTTNGITAILEEGGISVTLTITVENSEPSRNASLVPTVPPLVHAYQETTGDTWRYSAPDSGSAMGTFPIYTHPLLLSPGQTYRLGVEDTEGNYNFRYFQNSYSFASADDITVSGPQIINMVLPGGAPGAIQGTVTHNTTLLAGIEVYALRHNTTTSNWELTGHLFESGTETDPAGYYEITGLPPGNYVVFFHDPTGTYPALYHTGTDFDGAITAPVSLTTGQIQTVNMDLNVPIVPPGAGAGSGNWIMTGSQWEIHDSGPGWHMEVYGDPSDGEIDINISTYGMGPATAGVPNLPIETEAVCSSGLPAYDVTLVVDASPYNTTPYSYPMAPINAGSALHRADIPVSDLQQMWDDGTAYNGASPPTIYIDHMQLTVNWKCPETPPPDSTHTKTIGELNLIDPSGFITDADTGEPVAGAKVTLYKVRGWGPKSRPNDTTPNTCQSHNSKSPEEPWNQPAPTDQGIIAITSLGEISPAINPQTTNSAGHYAWDVVAGCWYIIVQAEGYQTKVSPVVGVPPEVTDLNLELTPFKAAISRDSDDISLSWPHLDAGTTYQVWRSTNADFRAGLASSTQVGTVSPTGQTASYVDSGAASDSSNYYYIVRALDSDALVMGSSNRVGLFKMTVSPGWNLLSWPLLPAETSLDAVIGSQLHGTDDPLTADRILVWDEESQSYSSAWFCSGACEAWGEPWANHWLANDYSQSALTLEPDTGFWLQNRSGATETVMLLGDVATAARSVSVASGWQTLASTFPSARSLDDLKLPATGTDDPLTADRILVWDAESNSFTSAWYCGGPCEDWGEPWANHWLANDYSQSPIVIEPGHGFWYQNRHEPFSWDNPQ